MTKPDSKWICYNTGDIKCTSHLGVELSSLMNDEDLYITTKFGAYQLSAVDIPCLECHFDTKV